MDSSDAESIISRHGTPKIVVTDDNDDLLPGYQETRERDYRDRYSGTTVGPGNDRTADPASEESIAPPRTGTEKLLREHPTVVSEDEPEDYDGPNKVPAEVEGRDGNTSFIEAENNRDENRNNEGLRSSREYSPSPSVKTRRRETARDSVIESSSTQHSPTIQTPKRRSNTSRSGQRHTSPLVKDNFLTISDPGKQAESPSLDLEQRSPRPPEVISPRPPKTIDVSDQNVVDRPDGPVQPGDPDFRRSFTQEQGQNRDTPLKCALYMNDVFGDFLTSEMEDGDHLWDLVVLTGEREPWLTTCGEYVTATWPESIGAIQELFSLLERNVRDVQFEQRFLAHPSSDLTLSTYRRSSKLGTLDFSVTFDGPTAPQADMAEALTWLFSVLQQVTVRNGEPHLQAAVARWKKKESRRHGASRYELTLYHMEPLIVPHSEACWTELVPHTASAVCFWTNERPSEMAGIEISFELLCFLAGLQYEVVEDGGVILYGKVRSLAYNTPLLTISCWSKGSWRKLLSGVWKSEIRADICRVYQHSLVYPVRQHLGCVQWHFQPYDEALTSRRLPYQITRKRLLVDDINFLRDQPRHFLGLWSDPQVTLGAIDSKYTTINWSNASEMKKETVWDGSTFGGTFNVPKVLTLTWSRTYKIARSRRNQYMANFEADLHRMVNSPVVLYSPSEKRAWMVSFVSVLLHLTRVRAELQKGLNYEIPPCERRGNGGQAAFDCLQACYRLPVKKAAPYESLSEEELNFTVEDYVREVLAAMELAKRESCRAKRFVFQAREQVSDFSQKPSRARTSKLSLILRGAPHQ